MIRLITKLLASFLLVATAAADASRPAEDPLAGLEEAIESARNQWGAPGLAVAIVKDDAVVLAKGFGTKHAGKDDPVDEHTLFTLASTTKAFTALAVGMLVEDGKLGWDDPVIQRLSGFRVADPYVTRAATIRDLLAHRTGVEEMDVLWSRGFDTPTSLARVPHAQQVASLRSAWHYNNILYVAAAEIVARTAGMSFQEFVTQRIFAPLGMNDSMFTGPELARRRNVTGAHLIEDGAPREIEPWSSPGPLGAAGVQSSAADMAKWLRMLLNQGSFGGKNVVAAETIAESLRPQMLVRPIGYPAAAELAKPHFFAYGLGWFVQDYKGRLLAMHTGSLYGANALAAIVPEERLGLVILINAAPVEYRHAFMYDVIDRYLGDRERDWNAEVRNLYARLQAQAGEERAKALRARPADTQPSGPLSDYSGMYTNPLAGDVEVVVKEDGLLAILMPPAAAFSLTHWSYDVFEASDDRAPREGRSFVTFTRGADGAISGFDIADGRTYRRKAASQH